MRAAARRLAALNSLDRAPALAVVSDAVWAVTIVDAAMVRYHPDAYERVLDAETSANRQLIEESVAGLRFVRNRIHDDAVPAQLLGPEGGESGAGSIGTRGWTWKSVPEPALARSGSRARAWETARYRAYQARLAGHPVGEVFERTVVFLVRTATEATVINDVGV